MPAVIAEDLGRAGLTGCWLPLCLALGESGPIARIVRIGVMKGPEFGPILATEAEPNPAESSHSYAEHPLLMGDFFVLRVRRVSVYLLVFASPPV